MRRSAVSWLASPQGLVWVLGQTGHQSLPQVQERATGTGARESWFTAALNQPGLATARQLLFPPDELVQVQRLVEPQLA